MASQQEIPRPLSTSPTTTRSTDDAGLPLETLQSSMPRSPAELAGVADVDCTGQQALVTGSTSGIGREAALALGRLGTAERLLRRAIESDEATPEMWNNLGVVLVEKGDFLEAEQMLRRAYALDNGSSDAIRDNLRLALAKSQDSGYDADTEQEYKVVRRGGGQYLLRKIP